MSLSDELTRACLSGPVALRNLIKAKGLQLGNELNILREALSAIVLKGAQPKLLAVIAEQLKGLSVVQRNNSDTSNAITELIMIENKLKLEWINGKGYVYRAPDPALRKSITSAVREALLLMPEFNVKQDIQISNVKQDIPHMALAFAAFYVYEALTLPLGPFADQILFRCSYQMANPVAMETLGRLIESAPIEELNAVHAKLEIHPMNQEYAAIIANVRADLKKRIRSKMQMALFLAIYKPVFGRKRTCRGCGIITEIGVLDPRLFHIIADMAFD